MEVFCVFEVVEYLWLVIDWFCEDVLSYGVDIVEVDCVIVVLKLF